MTLEERAKRETDELCERLFSQWSRTLKSTVPTVDMKVIRWAFEAGLCTGIKHALQQLTSTVNRESPEDGKDGKAEN